MSSTIEPTEQSPIMETRQIVRDLEGVRPFPADAIEGMTLLRQLGAGASSTVYLGKEHATGEHYAVKVMSAYYCRHEEALKRWRREAETLMRLTHPNIVRGVRHGFAAERPYFIMEYIQGETLQNRLRRLSTLTDEEVYRIGRSVLEALLAAHQIGVIHRDIKPSNIIRTGEGEIKLMDFGLAKEEDDRSLTIMGAVLGTPVYIAPEQARGDLQIDIRSDLYSLGITLFHLTTGEVPFGDLNTSLLLTKKITDDVPDIREFRKDAPAGMAYLIRRLCERERTARPTTPREALELLKAAENGEVTTATVTDELPSRRVRKPLEGFSVPKEIVQDNTLLETFAKDSNLTAKAVQLESKEVLFYEDDMTREAYVLLKGSVEVLKAGRQIAEINTTGSWLGEMSTLLNSPRTATIRAMGETTLLRVEEKNFHEFLRRHPEMCILLSESLAKRLEDTNIRLRESQRKLARIRKHIQVIERELED